MVFNINIETIKGEKHMLYYCEKCGGTDVLDFDVCVQCGSHNSYKPVPDEYVDGYAIKDSLKEQFIKNIVKSSPNFDQVCWDRRETFKEIQKHNNELLENDKVKQANVPRCPTCSSTNLKKITVTSKAMNTALFGLLGTKRHRTFHCNNCGYEW